MFSIAHVGVCDVRSDVANYKHKSIAAARKANSGMVMFAKQITASEVLAHKKNFWNRFENS